MSFVSNRRSKKADVVAGASNRSSNTREQIVTVSAVIVLCCCGFVAIRALIIYLVNSFNCSSARPNKGRLWEIWAVDVFRRMDALCFGQCGINAQIVFVVGMTIVIMTRMWVEMTERRMIGLSTPWNRDVW